MKKKKLLVIVSHFLLILTVVSWGYSFILQKRGMQEIDPFSMTAWRFLIGGIILLPSLVIVLAQKKTPSIYVKNNLRYSLPLGAILFFAANLQQLGLSKTTVTNSGFITNTYVIIVPILSLIFWKVNINLKAIIGIMITFLGLCILSIQSQLDINSGDIITLVSAFFWAFYIIYTGKFVTHTSPFILACFQFLICGILSLILAIYLQNHSLTYYIQEMWGFKKQLLILSVLSVAIAYTAQIIAQRYVSVITSTTILSLESVAASIFGWYFLGDNFTLRTIIGCFCMLFGCLMVQLAHLKNNR